MGCAPHAVADPVSWQRGDWQSIEMGLNFPVKSYRRSSVVLRHGVPSTPAAIESTVAAQLAFSLTGSNRRRFDPIPCLQKTSKLPAKDQQTG
jgi:hypothetical protein